jgi:hypothetical protein
MLRADGRRVDTPLSTAADHGDVLTFAEGAAAHTISSLRAACAVLDRASGSINAVSVSGLVPETEDLKFSILAVAQRLAAEHDLSVVISVEGRRFVVQFKRSHVANRPLPEAG